MKKAAMLFRTSFFLIAAVQACCMLSGCAGKWALKTDAPQSRIYWPPDAGKAKVMHLKTVTGFVESGSSASSVLRSIVIGRNDTNDIRRPVAISSGADGRFAVADTECRCVHLYVPADEKYIRIFSAGARELESPVGVAFDENLHLYVSDSVLGTISVFNREGAYVSSISKAGSNPLKRPTGLAYDVKSGLLYVADTLEHRVYGISRGNELRVTFGGRGDGNGMFNYPTYIFLDWKGRLHVVDSMNFRIQSFSADGRFLGFFGHHGDGSGDLSMPKGIAVDRDGVVFVADSLFDNVQMFSEDGEFLLTIGGRGHGHGEFWMPSGIFLDENGMLYVCDTFNQRVQIFSIASGIRGR